ncbi:MAG: F0F1 ATP synthase subunit delta [Bacteroidales bacterium]|jgi:F-type H+-transporting ATPase subunit delta|nr:F0F1 ATP synthase subunit delta [Bacteroidales bacterium]
MDNGKIATRYAKALLEHATEKHQEDRLYEEMKTLASSFALQPGLQHVLENPTIKAEDKQTLITTAAGITVGEAFDAFVRLVLKNGRETSCHSIALLYQRLYRLQKKVVGGRLISAQEIDNAAKERLKTIIKKNTGYNVDFSTQIDTSLIGGFILDVENTRLDASISNQLKEIQKQLLEKNKSIA